MVAGPNGSGKTTLIEALQGAGALALPDCYINADDLARTRGLDARAAQRLAARQRLDAIAAKRSFIYETVMSHPGKIAELQAAAQAGFVITVLYVATEHPDINIERVRLRVADGGHDVPRDRIRARHRRSLALAPSALAFAAHAYVYDNTPWGTEAGQPLQAALAGNRLRALVARPVPWVAALVDTVNARAAELERLCAGAGNRAALAAPNLLDGASEGAFTAVGEYYAFQIDDASGRAIVHDRALLAKPVAAGARYRVAYAEGVSKVTRLARARLVAVAKGSDR